MLRALCHVCLLFCVVSFASAQTDVAVRVPQITGAVSLPVPNDGSPRIFPAPDGTIVAYERAVRLNGHRDYYLCLIEASAGSVPFCSLIPQQTPRGFEPDPNAAFLPLSWSPDARYVAVVGQPLLSQVDTDLLVYDRESDLWRNLTEDGYEGDLPAAATLELQPAWSPDSSMIAVERITITAENVRESALAFINAQTGEVRSFVPLPGGNAAGETGVVGGLAWSPDGSMLAISLLYRTPDINADGIWLVNVETGESRRIVDFSSAQAALNKIYADLPLKTLGGLAWSPDGTHLLFWAGNPDKKPIVAWAFAANVESGAVMPIDLPVLAGDTPEKRTLRPIQAAWSPDSTRLVVLSPGRDRAIPETPLDSANPAARMSVYAAAVSGENSVLLGHLPLTASIGLYPAAWGTEYIIINGYSLQIAPE